MTATPNACNYFPISIDDLFDIFHKDKRLWFWNHGKVFIQCRFNMKNSQSINFMEKTHSILNFETIPIHYNKGFIVVLYLYVEELFKYFYLIIFSKSFQIKPSWFGVIPNMQWNQPGEKIDKNKSIELYC